VRQDCADIKLKQVVELLEVVLLAAGMLVIVARVAAGAMK
jgi:hypothetical protein